MAAPTITIIGNLASDPELRFTPSGRPVLNGRVLNTPRKKGVNGEWEDQPTIGYDWSLWGAKGEAAAEELRRGDKVIIYGTLRASEWENKETGKRNTKTSIDVYELGKAVKASNPSYGSQASAGGSDADPWATDDSQDVAPF